MGYYMQITNHTPLHNTHTLHTSSVLTLFLLLLLPLASMYPHSATEFSSAADYLADLASPQAASAPATIMPCRQYQLAISDQIDSELSLNSCSSGCSSYGSPSSLASHDAMLQRSSSSHSLQKSGGIHHPLSALFADLLDVDSEFGPVRKVYSTGDLQRINGMQQNQQSESPLRSESSMIIEGMSRAYPYSPEEKKVRIERYRIKKNQRNFNKKIKYACRKTLADSRPRIRGRFAKNEELEKKSHVGEYEEDENWANFFETLVAANLVHEP